MILNQTGQGSSVFQLLIAAVVAIAILSVLFGVLDLAKFFNVGQDPTTAAAETLKGAYTAPSNIKSSRTSLFNFDTTLNVKGIAAAAKGGPQADDLCLTLGDFATNNRGFEFITDGKALRYKGSSPAQARIDVICDYGETELDRKSTRLNSSHSSISYSLFFF